MNWYIGQPIVAIENSPDMEITKCTEYVIKGLGVECSCGSITIDVGVETKYKSKIFICPCGRRPQNLFDGFNERRFAPLDVDISELTEILTKELTNQ